MFSMLFVRFIKYVKTTLNTKVTSFNVYVQKPIVDCRTRCEVYVATPVFAIVDY
jgi:hypothetical protein